MRLFIILLILVVILVIAESIEDGSFSSLLSHIQRETASVATAHHNIKSFLHSKNIQIGQIPVKSNSKAAHIKANNLITISTVDNNIDCRISLEKVPIGCKCLAPCGCSGSNRWITFSVLNRLRRKDPEQWKVCRTCLKPFDYGAIYRYGGVKGNLLSVLLDNNLILRILFLSFLAIFSAVSKLHLLILRLATSKIVWKLYPRWSRIVHLPFVFQLWGGKILLSYISSLYSQLEKKAVMALAEVETSLIEAQLPVTVRVDSNDELVIL